MFARIVSFVVLLSILIGVLPLGANAAGELVGDIDKDGEITVSDALRILRVCARLDQYDESEIGIYDVWSDGKVGVEDALGVLRSSIGLIGNFGRTGVELRFEPNEKAVECGVTNEMLERSIETAKAIPVQADTENDSVAGSAFIKNRYAPISTKESEPSISPLAKPTRASLNIRRSFCGASSVSSIRERIVTARDCVPTLPAIPRIKDWKETIMGRASTTFSKAPTTADTASPINRRAISQGTLFFKLAKRVSSGSSSALKAASFA